MQTEFGGTLAQVIDLPYIPLSHLERAQTKPLIEQILLKADEILMGTNAERLSLGANRQLLVSRPQAFRGRIYDDSDLVVEVYVLEDGEIIERENSFAFYPQVVISRPNRDIVKRQDIEKAWQEGPKNHEATYEELEALLEQMGVAIPIEEYLL